MFSRKYLRSLLFLMRQMANKRLACLMSASRMGLTLLEIELEKLIKNRGTDSTKMLNFKKWWWEAQDTMAKVVPSKFHK